MIGPDTMLIVALLLLVLGVIGTVVPLLPGVLFSVIGVVLYWWSTGFTEPRTVFVVVTVLVGILAVIVDYGAGAISAKAGGASNRTVVAATVVGLLLFLVTGPVGLIVGVTVTVFAVEFRRTRQMEQSLRAALYATVGLLASTLVQFLIAVAVLTGFVLTVVL